MTRIEFQNTGYFVIRAHKAAFGSAKSNPRYAVFLRDQRQIGEGVIIGSFQDEGGVFEFRVASDAAEGVGADVTFADVPVTIDARIISGTRVVEVDGANVLCLYWLLHSFQQRFEAVFHADVIPRGDSVCGVETNSKWKLRTEAQEVLKMLEAVSDALALSRRVL